MARSADPGAVQTYVLPASVCSSTRISAAEVARHANAASAAWRHMRKGLAARMKEHNSDSSGHAANARERVAALKVSIAEKRKLGGVAVDLSRKEDRGKH